MPTTQNHWSLTYAIKKLDWLKILGCCFLFVWFFLNVCGLGLLGGLLEAIFFIYFYLFLAVLGLRFCARAFSSWGKRGPLFIAVHGPLTIATSLVAEHRLQTRRLSSCDSRAQPLRGMWDLPRPGLEPVSPALAGRFSTTVPPGEPDPGFLLLKYFIFTFIG